MGLRGQFIHSRGQEGVWHSLFEKEGDGQGEENGLEFWFSRGSGFEATRWPLTSDARSRPPTAGFRPLDTPCEQRRGAEDQRRRS